MQEICDQWNKEMESMRKDRKSDAKSNRLERRLMILSVVALAGVRILGL